MITYVTFVIDFAQNKKSNTVYKNSNHVHFLPFFIKFTKKLQKIKKYIGTLLP